MSLIKVVFLASILGGMLVFTVAFAHPGNTASDGCHYCRTNCSYWGVPWNTRHCHNGYTAPVRSWSCDISGKTFYSHASASEYWYSQIDDSVKDTYRKLLERETNDNDISYWHSRFPYNNCNGGSWNSRTIWDEVLASDERKELLAKKIPSPISTPSPEASEKPDYSWAWWLIFPAIGVGSWIANRKL